MNVTYSTIEPPKRLRSGRKSPLTKLQEIELWSWYQARQALGTYAAKAKEFGITGDELMRQIRHIRSRKGQWQD